MALASPYPDVEIPDLSVPAFVLAAGRDRPEAPALIDGLKGDTITHGQLAGYKASVPWCGWRCSTRRVAR